MARRLIARQTSGARRSFLRLAHRAHMAQSFASAPISEGIPGTGSSGTGARYRTNDCWFETIRTCPPTAAFVHWPITSILGLTGEAAIEGKRTTLRYRQDAPHEA